MTRRFVAMTALLLSLPGICHGRVFLDITKNFSEKPPLVILLNQPKTEYWTTFLSAFAQDFRNSGCMTVARASLVSDNELSDARKNVTTEFVVTASTEGNRVTFTVEDLLDNVSLCRQTLSKADDAVSFAHTASDAILLALSGKPGAASSLIAYVSDRGGSYQLWAIGFDGFKPVQITNEKNMVHYPKWGAGNRELIAVSYRDGWPKLVKVDIGTGAMNKLVGEPGLNACVSVCQATQEMALVLSRTGDAEIYLADLSGKNIRRLTYSRGVDGSPSFSPDGKAIAFASDREGSAQIFVMNRDGFQVRRISYVGGSCTSPAWSPDGTLIAYSFQRGNRFGLALYDVSTHKTAVIAENLGCETVCWAPDSRHVVCDRTNERPSGLQVVDIYTKEVRRLPTGQGNAFSPACSF